MNLYRLPGDVDLVVGVPRSGLLVANVIALMLNLPLATVRDLLDNRPLNVGRTRKCARNALVFPAEAKHVLVVDDSVASGGSMAHARGQIEARGVAQRVSYCAIYASGRHHVGVDFVFETVGMPRMFEWNVMHHPLLSSCCVDIDGILCFDPSPVENDDGEQYVFFLNNARPLMRPSLPIGHLVTSRLEKFRTQTEEWLHLNGIQFGQLHMLDLPSADDRRRLNAHATFKASIYRGCVDAPLFIESEPDQAATISNASGKPVLCYPTQQMFMPGVSVKMVQANGRFFLSRVVRKLHTMLGRRI
ncbi:MAG: phosphoribosyltransferase [Sterolibacteriaceae bacterium]|nr:phosphoribosyltransferase [Sterolibacteriaceae bacterium]